MGIEYREEWVVYGKPAFDGRMQALRYLGHYTHRVAHFQSSCIRVPLLVGRLVKDGYKQLFLSADDEFHEFFRGLSTDRDFVAFCPFASIVNSHNALGSDFAQGTEFLHRRTLGVEVRNSG